MATNFQADFGSHIHSAPHISTPFQEGTQLFPLLIQEEIRVREESREKFILL